MTKLKKILLILIVAFSYGHKGKHPFITPYISPGIQIGYNDNNGLILSPQLTIGTGFTFNHFEDTMPFFIGKTFGLKTYYKKNAPTVIYKFTDNQISFLLAGIGTGKLINSNGKSFKSSKIWVGAIGLLEYEKIYFKNNIEKHYSILTVLPLPIFLPK